MCRDLITSRIHNSLTICVVRSVADLVVPPAALLLVLYRVHVVQDHGAVRLTVTDHHQVITPSQEFILKSFFTRKIPILVKLFQLSGVVIPAWRTGYKMETVHDSIENMVEFDIEIAETDTIPLHMKNQLEEPPAEVHNLYHIQEPASWQQPGQKMKSISS